MTLGSLGVRGVDGDVEACVPHGVRGGGEPACVSHLSPDGNREQASDPEVLAQCRAPRLGEAELRQVALDRCERLIEGLDVREARFDRTPSGWAEIGLVKEDPPEVAGERTGEGLDALMEQRRVDSLGPRSPFVGEVLVQPDGRACLENVSWRDPALGKRAGHEKLAKVTGISSVGLGPLLVAPQGGSVSRFGKVCHEAGGRKLLNDI